MALLAPSTTPGTFNTGNTGMGLVGNGPNAAASNGTGQIVGGANETEFQQNNALSPTNLLPGQRNFSDETQNEISQFGTNAANAGQNLVNTANGTAQNGQMIQDRAAQQGNENTALGMASNPDLSAALSRTSNNNFQNTLSKMKSNLAFQAPTYQSQQQAQYGQYLAANEQNKNSNYQQQVAYQTQQQQLYQQWQQAQQSASTSAIGSIFGALGTIAGGIGGALIGGPAGAVAGAAAGGAIGKAV